MAASSGQPAATWPLCHGHAIQSWSTHSQYESLFTCLATIPPDVCVLVCVKQSEKVRQHVVITVGALRTLRSPLYGRHVVSVGLTPPVQVSGNQSGPGIIWGIVIG